VIESVAGNDLLFDPNKRDPTAGFGLCLDYLESCMILNSTVDGCIAAAHRCSTTTPWLGDPSGNDCCPQGCLVAYLTARENATPAAALQAMLQSNCYAPSGSGGTADGGSE
jgi:hypothetical protein